MKLLVKFGLAGAGFGALLLSGSVGAVNAMAQADFVAIQNAQARARAENDRIKLSCVNDKLVLAKAVYNIIDAGDESKVPQMHELRVAAEECLGKASMYSTSGNSFSGPPGLVQPGSNPPDWGATFEPPVNASPSVPSTGRTSRYSRSYGIGIRRRY